MFPLKRYNLLLAASAALTVTPRQNMAACSACISVYSWKYSMPLRMLNSVQQICSVGTITMTGNIFRPCRQHTSAADAVLRLKHEHEGPAPRLSLI
jgi:hypothetical protein